MYRFSSRYKLRLGESLLFRTESGKTCKRTFVPVACDDCITHRKNFVSRTEKRAFQTSSCKLLELEDGASIQEWLGEYWERNMHAKKRSLRNTAVAFSTVLSSIHQRPSAHSSIRVFMSIVPENEKLIFPENSEEQDDYVKSSNALALSPYNTFGPYPIHFIMENRYHTAEEWEALIAPSLEKNSRNATLASVMEFILLVNKTNYLIDKNVDAEKHLDGPLVRSFLEFLFEEQNIEFAQRSLLPYFAACFKFSRKDLIETSYGRLKEHTDVFGINFMAVMFIYLDDTKWWRDLRHFRNVLMQIGALSETEAKYLLTYVSLNHGEFESAMKAMHNVVTSTNNTLSPRFEKLFKKLLEQFRYSEDPKIWSRNKELIETFLMVMEENSWYPTKTIADELAKWFTEIKDENWQFAHVPSAHIERTLCPFTNVSMKEKTMSDEEYDYLAKIVLKNILQMQLKKSVSAKTYSFGTSYVHSNPREIRSFLTLMYESGPFDIVIDGLNLYYNMKAKTNNSRRVLTSDLASAWLRNYLNGMEFKNNRRLNVLVVLRDHLKHQLKNSFSDFATVWYSENESSDDPFFVYGAILSGRNCKLLTLDTLRDLRYALGQQFDHRVCLLLYKWQQIHQSLILLPPKTYSWQIPQNVDIAIQRTDTTWHIPYHDGKAVPDKWLVLKNDEG